MERAPHHFDYVVHNARVRRILRSQLLLHRIPARITQMKITLLVMAAGIGSRFGGGIKQLAPVGVNGELIMDFSVHDAIEAGFNRIIFVIRKDIEQDFRALIGARLESVCNHCGVEIAYAYQDLQDIPCAVPEGRTKPWGTGHAVLAARELIDFPFVVINADDYYGKTAYRALHDFLVANQDGNSYAMAGFILKNTLSDNGSVTRGICCTEDGMLRSVTETHNIIKTTAGAAANGIVLPDDSLVSMNMWALTPAFVEQLQEHFAGFLLQMRNPLTDEFLLPVFIDRLLQTGKVCVKVLETPDQWFGVTYQEDRPLVVQAIRSLIDSGVYCRDLYSDLH